MTKDEKMQQEAAASHVEFSTRLAVVETQVQNIMREQKLAREAAEATRDDVKAIRSAVDQGKGGLHLLLAFGIPATILTGLIAAVVTFLQYMTGKN